MGEQKKTTEDVKRDAARRYCIGAYWCKEDDAPAPFAIADGSPIRENAGGRWVRARDHARTEESLARASSALASARAEVEALRRENELYARAVAAVRELIAESRGVDGLHLNGDVATWAELSTGGWFEAWLIDLDNAPAAREPGRSEA